MSIASEITRLQTAKADLKTAIEGKGVTVPSSATLDDYADLVDDIQTGGGGVDYMAANINGTLTSYESDDVTSVRQQALRGFGTLTGFKCHNVTSFGNGGYAFYQTAIVVLAFPKVTSVNTQALAGIGATFTTLDLGESCTSIGNQSVSTNSNFDTLILRKANEITTVQGNSLNGTKFASGGAGGTIYIPKALYDHLGDNSSLDYKAATNWSAYNGYGTVTWAKIEGSQYEHYYADGTPIPSA